jgi:20S proteasome alpha/beta subunit
MKAVINELARLTDGILKLAIECNCRAEHGADGAEHLRYMEERLRELIEVDDAVVIAARAVVNARYDTSDRGWDNMKEAIGQLEDLVGRSK